MTTTYRLVEIMDSGDERDIGVAAPLTIPPSAALVVTLPRGINDADRQRVHEDLRTYFDAYPHWKDMPIIVIRAGDVQLGCLVQVDDKGKAL